MNATVLALLNLNHPGWINKLSDTPDEFSHIIIQHYRRLGLRNYTEVLIYAEYHDDYLVPATGKYTSSRAPRM